MPKAPKRPPIKQEKFEPSDVADMLTECRGLVQVAERRLACNPKTIYQYVKKHAVVREALQDARAYMTDTAELALFNAIQERAPWAVCFYLKTQGRDRGYAERPDMVPPLQDDRKVINVIIGTPEGKQVPLAEWVESFRPRDV